MIVYDHVYSFVLQYTSFYGPFDHVYGEGGTIEGAEPGGSAHVPLRNAHPVVFAWAALDLDSTEEIEATSPLLDAYNKAMKAHAKDEAIWNAALPFHPHP